MNGLNAKYILKFAILGLDLLVIALFHNPNYYFFCRHNNKRIFFLFSHFWKLYILVPPSSLKTTLHRFDL